MINATFNRSPTISAPPPKVFYPFLFRAVGESVYLRISQSQIVRLYSGYPDGAALQGMVVTGGSGPLAWSVEGEQEAWAARLKAGESVTLSNP